MAFKSSETGYMCVYMRARAPQFFFSFFEIHEPLNCLPSKLRKGEICGMVQVVMCIVFCMMRYFFIKKKNT